MRFGVLLDPLAGERPLEALVAQARGAEEAGFDLVWLEETHGTPGALPSPLVAAAALAPAVSAVRVGVTALVGESHPLSLGEEAAVADLALGGRLVLSVRASPGTEARLAECVDLLLAAQAARPFRHEGPTWPSPSNLPENTFNVEERARVTPAPAQLEMPLWVAGPGGATVARERGLSYLAGAGDAGSALQEIWRETESRLGPACRRLRRPAMRDVTLFGEEVDRDGMVEALRAESGSWGLDVVVLRLPAGMDRGARQRAIWTLGSRVRPRVQLHRLPPGLEDLWARRAGPS